MKVYKLNHNPPDPTTGDTSLVAANSMAEAVSALGGKEVFAAQELGPLLFAESLATANGRQVTQAELKASITETHIISFEDGSKMKSLKRHLAKHGLTFEQYK